MKKAILVLTSVFFISQIHAQTRAVTETGEEVFLYNDGTWKYKNEKEITLKDIPTNPKKFKKEDQSTFLLKSSKLNVDVYLNPKLWSFGKAKDNPEAEYELQLKGEDLYGKLISEKVEIPLETLKLISVEKQSAGY